MQFEDVGAFYRAAHLGLRALDGRGVKRRFGTEADARWRAFKGDLHEGDRFDLLLRDAAIVTPLAFAPREVYALRGLTREDPFGPDWPGPPRGLSGQLLRADEAVPTEPVVAFDTAAALWEVKVPVLDPSTLPRIGPATRVVAGGLASVRALLVHFNEQRESLDLGDQVLLVADRPEERQLFGLAVVFLGLSSTPRAVGPGASREKVAALGFPRCDVPCVAGDASPEVRDTVLGLVDRAS